VETAVGSVCSQREAFESVYGKSVGCAHTLLGWLTRKLRASCCARSWVGVRLDQEVVRFRHKGARCQSGERVIPDTWSWGCCPQAGVEVSFRLLCSSTRVKAFTPKTKDGSKHLDILRTIQAIFLLGVRHGNGRHQPGAPSHKTLDEKTLVFHDSGDFVGLVLWGDRTLVLAHTKAQGVIGYEFVFWDFLVGVVVIPAITYMVLGVATAVAVYSIRSTYRNTFVILEFLGWFVFLLSAPFYFVLSLPVILGRGLASLLSSPHTFLWVYRCVAFLWRLPTLPFRLVLELYWFVVEVPFLCAALLQRFRYPSGVPLASEQGRLARGDFVAVGSGRRRAAREGLAHVSASGALSHVPRLRPRGRATCMAQDLLEGPVGSVGKFFRGRWTPDLPADRRSPVLNALITASGSEVKLLGCGAVHSTGRNPTRYLYVVVEDSQGERQLILPTLSSRLNQYSFLRESNPDLLRGLRARAVDWFKKSELPAWLGDLVLPTAVARACLQTSVDRQARSILDAAGKASLLSDSE